MTKLGRSWFGLIVKGFFLLHGCWTCPWSHSASLMWRAKKKHRLQILWCSALTRQSVFAQYKCDNTVFVPAVCSFYKSFCYRIKIRNISSQMSAIVSILWHPLVIFFLYLNMFYLLHHPDHLNSIPPFSQWTEPGRHLWTSEPIRSSWCSSGKCCSSTLLFFLFLLTPVIIDSCVLPFQRLLPTNRRASATDA